MLRTWRGGVPVPSDAMGPWLYCSGTGDVAKGGGSPGDPLLSPCPRWGRCSDNGDDAHGAGCAHGGSRTAAMPTAQIPTAAVPAVLLPAWRRGDARSSNSVVAVPQLQCLGQ